MALSVETLTWDCRSPEDIARFWAEVLGYDLVELDESSTTRKVRLRNSD